MNPLDTINRSLSQSTSLCLWFLVRLNTFTLACINLLQSSDAKRVTKEVKAAYDRCHKLTTKYFKLHQHASDLCSSAGLKPPPLWVPQHLQGSVDMAAAAAAAMTPNLNGGRTSPDDMPPRLDLSAPASLPTSDPGITEQPRLTPVPEASGLDSGRTATNAAAETEEDTIGHGKGRAAGYVSPASSIPGASGGDATPRRLSQGFVEPSTVPLALSRAGLGDQHAGGVDKSLFVGLTKTDSLPTSSESSSSDTGALQGAADANSPGITANPYAAAVSGLSHDASNAALPPPRVVPSLGIASGMQPRSMPGLSASGRSDRAMRLPADASGRSSSVGPWFDSSRSGSAKDDAAMPNALSTAAPLAPQAARIRRLPAEDDTASVSSGTSAGNTDTLAAAISSRVKSSMYFSLASALGGGAAAQSTAERIESIRAVAQVCDLLKIITMA